MLSIFRHLSLPSFSDLKKRMHSIAQNVSNRLQVRLPSWEERLRNARQKIPKLKDRLARNPFFPILIVLLSLLFFFTTSSLADSTEKFTSTDRPSGAPLPTTTIGDLYRRVAALFTSHVTQPDPSIASSSNEENICRQTKELLRLIPLINQPEWACPETPS